MKFSDSEMMFMISVSRGRKPLGIDIKIPEESQREEYIKDAIYSLRNKNIVDENLKLTKEGADLLFFFETYRNSYRHVALDQIYAAVLPRDRLITVMKKEDGYELNCISSSVLLEALLGYSEFLKCEDHQPGRGNWENTTVEELFQRIQNSTGGVWVKRFTGGKPDGEKFYGWDKQQGYVVNLERNRIRSLSPLWMRKQLCQLVREGE